MVMSRGEGGPKMPSMRALKVGGESGGRSSLKMKTKSDWEDECQKNSHLFFVEPGGKHPIRIVEEKHH